MPIKKVIADQRVPVKIWTDDVDQRSIEQLTNIASLPFIHHHVAAMPDVHLGIGATIGSVIATHSGDSVTRYDLCIPQLLGAVRTSVYPV